MSYFLAPIVNTQQFDANGNPLVSGQIFTYLAGTTTPVPTYTDNTGLTQQTNPIILNTLGNSASPVWLLGQQTYKFVIKDNASNILRTVDNLSGINDTVTVQSEWIESGFNPVFISATSFSVAGDQTGTLQPLRRILTTNTTGDIYSTISTSVYGAPNTTVTVVNDSGVLDGGLSALSYGILSATNPAIPETPAGEAFRTSTATATLVARAYNEYLSNTDISTVIPSDDTIPQVTEGTQILSVSITPQSITSRVRIRFQGETSIAAAPNNAVCALFVNGGANAIAANYVTHANAANAIPLGLEIEIVPGVTTAQTYTLRVGPATAGTMRLNGTTGGRAFGGVSRATLIAEEIAPL